MGMSRPETRAAHEAASQLARALVRVFTRLLVFEDAQHGPSLHVRSCQNSSRFSHQCVCSSLV